MPSANSAVCANGAALTVASPPAPAPVPLAPATSGVTSMWVIAGLAAAPAVAQGFGRFAYALVLPSMRADLGWSYADAGAMSTANAIGYLFGALAAASVAARFGAKRVFLATLVISALAIAFSAAAPDYWPHAALRVLAGFTGGVAFVIGGSIAAAAAAGGGAGRAPTAIGVYVGGGGAGIALSAIAVPPAVIEAGWQGGWVVLGLLSGAAALVAGFALRRAPAPAAPSGARGGFSIRPIGFAFIAYGVMGAGYIAYATFIVAFLKAELAFSPIEISAFWATLGAAAVGSAFVWGPILSRLRGGLGLAAAAATMTTGVILVLVEPTRSAAFVSAVLFGGSGFATITAVTSLARRTFPPQAWTTAIGALTTSFGLGQIIGPVLSGAVSDGPTGLRAGLTLSVWIMLAGVAIATLQRERRA